MNENKKLLIVLGALVLIITLIILLVIGNNIKQKAEYEKFEKAFYGSENTLLYINQTSCSWCQLFNPTIQEMSTRYGFDYLSINMTTYNQTNLSKVLETLGLTSVETLYLAIISNGKVVETTANGYADYDELFDLLQRNGIIDEDAQLLLNYITIDEYQEILSSKEVSVVVIGQTSCQHCVNAKLTLNQVVEQTGAKINYLNVTNIKTEEEQNILYDSVEYFEENTSWGTPVMFILKDGKLIDVLEGETTKDKYIEFLEENGVL